MFKRRNYRMIKVLLPFMIGGIGLAIINLTRPTSAQYVGRPVQEIAQDSPELAFLSRLTGDRALYKAGEVIVKFKPGVAANSVRALASSEGASVKRKLRLRKKNVYLLNVPNGMGEFDFIRELERNPNVIYAERNAYYYLFNQLSPADPNYPEQWALNNTGQSYPIPDGKTTSGTSDCDVDAPEAWYDVNDAFGRVGDPNIVIAVIDTGVDINHPDLMDGIWVNAGEIPNNGIDDDNDGYIDDVHGWDFVNDDNDPEDSYGHGTHCAGIAAGVTANNTCIAGTSWGCTVMALKVANGYSVPLAPLVEAIDYAADPNHRADVISMSIGGESSAQTLGEAVRDAYNAGCVVVASAANTASPIPQYPASYPQCISVSATDSNDDLAWFSSYGCFVDVAAPGVDILSLHAPGTDMYGDKKHFYPDGDPDAEMYIASGTSMACPHVAGLAGLCLSVDPNLTPDEMKWLIRNSSDDLGDRGWDRYYGAGRINLHKAVHGLINGISKATNPFPDSNSTGASVNVDLSWTPGYYALSHDVYFGTDFNDVNDANTSSSVFKDNQHDNVFRQDTLNPNTTYYWRIDETNDTSTAKGNVWSFTTDSNSGIFYVDANADPNGNGSSWGTAFDNLQDALEAAGSSGDEIWVAEGTYKPSKKTDPCDSRSATFLLANGVKLYGGFAGTETRRDQRDPNVYNNQSILSGDIGTVSDINDNCYHVVTGAGDSDTVIDGFTITKGFADSTATAYGRLGGGVYNEWNVTVSNCKIVENRADYSGGGILNLSGDATEVTNCTFSGNATNNSDGGGIFTYGSNVTLTNCVFSTNSALWGAGIAFCSFGSNCLVLTNCTLSNNSASGRGGGLSVLSFVESEATVTNCIFWNNEAEDTGNEIYDPYGITTVTYSDVNGGYSGTGNINSDPLFVDPNNEDYHLGPNSPCINAGDPNGDYDGQKDIDRHPRVMAARVDIGADEFSGIFNLDQEEWYASIQDALDDANENETIEVGPATYYESVDSNGIACTLRGADPNDWGVVEATIVDANGANWAVELDANATLKGFTVRNGDDCGILCAYSASPTISNCVIKDNSDDGIWLNGAGSVTITNNKILDNGRLGIYAFLSDATIKNNWIWANAYGGSGSVSVAVTYRNNTIVGNGTYGILRNPHFQSAVAISNCILWDNGDDLSACSATYSCISDCNDANGTGNICGDGNDPCFAHYFDFSDKTTAVGTTTTIKVADANIYEVNDVIEYDNDGEARTVTDVNTTSDIVTFANDALDANSVSGKRVHNWGVGETDVDEDYHLLSGSPCIDAGDPNGTYTGEVDIDFEDRVIGDYVDMGGDERDPNS